jgi:hypothetical protein
MIMEDVLRYETTQPIMSEMKQQLPRIKKMLDISPTAEVHVLDYDYFPREYMGTKFRDKVVATAGVLEGLPHIQRQRLQTPGRVGIGIYIYQNTLDPGIKYALYCVRGTYRDETYMIVPKRQLTFLWRNAIKLNKLANQDAKPPVLEDGLLDSVVKNTVGFLKKAKLIEKYGVKIKRGLLLMGDPGNGKTMLCRYIQKLCSQNGIDWGVITSADIDGAYNENSLNDLFRQYTVSFFDDIDIQYMDRKSGNGKMACSLLTAMDGLVDTGHLVRIFTTNEEVKDLDKAFTRPGRIDKLITLKKPTLELRRQLVETWPEEIKNNIDVERCVKESDDFSFAELEAIRTFLVTNKVIDGLDWNLETAFHEFHSRREENEKNGVGFTSAKLKQPWEMNRGGDQGEPCVAPNSDW